MNKRDYLNFLLTSLEPNSPTVTLPTSIGGYPSSILFRPRMVLLDSLTTTTQAMEFDGATETPQHILIGEEILKVNSYSDLDGEYGLTIATDVSRGQIGTQPMFHAAGKSAYSLAQDGFFNSSLENGIQYRCLAITNSSDNLTFSNLRFYVKNEGINPNCEVKLSIEVPRSSIYRGTAASGTTISLRDSSLVNAYPDDYFKGRVITIDDTGSLNINVSRTVASFDKQTGTLTFTVALPYPLTTGTSYRVDEVASQRMPTGRNEPLSDTDATVRSDWSTAKGIQNAVSIDVGGRLSGADLLPHEVVYLWFRRDISSSTETVQNNCLIFTAVYH